MKNVITLITALIFLSVTVDASCIGKNKKKRNRGYSTVAVAQLIVGDPDEDVPMELAYLKAKNAMVPIAPFEWVDPMETAPVF